MICGGGTFGWGGCHPSSGCVTGARPGLPLPARRAISVSLSQQRYLRAVARPGERARPKAVEATGNLADKRRPMIRTPRPASERWPSIAVEPGSPDKAQRRERVPHAWPACRRSALPHRGRTRQDRCHGTAVAPQRQSPRRDLARWSRRTAAPPQGGHSGRRWGSASRHRHATRERICNDNSRVLRAVLPPQLGERGLSRLVRNAHASAA